MYCVLSVRYSVWVVRHSQVGTNSFELRPNDIHSGSPLGLSHISYEALLSVASLLLGSLTWIERLTPCTPPLVLNDAARIPSGSTIFAISLSSLPSAPFGMRPGY